MMRRLLPYVVAAVVLAMPGAARADSGTLAVNPLASGPDLADFLITGTVTKDTPACDQPDDTYCDWSVGAVVVESGQSCGTAVPVAAAFANRFYGHGYTH